MTKSFLSKKNRTKRLHDGVVSLSHPYIHTYINPQTQPGDRAVIQSYTLQKPYMGSNCKYIQSALLNLSMEDNQNVVFIINTK